MGRQREDKKAVNIKHSGCTVIGELADPIHPCL